MAMRFSLIISFLILGLCVYSQDINYARKIDSTISSPYFSGRGYIDKGVNKAAAFIKSELSNFGVSSFENQYSQPFNFPINTITEVNEFTVDGIKLEAGKDFVVASCSKSGVGTHDLVYLPDSIYENKKLVSRFLSDKSLKNKFIVTEYRFKDLKKMEAFPAKGLIILNDEKVIWSVSDGQKVSKFPVFEVLRGKITKHSKSITFGFKSKFIKKYETENIVGYVKGIEKPDSFIIFTAHYDHLGKMGKDVYFPGASDNGSGVSMVLDMARHYSTKGNEPKYSMVFMFFSGEEVGLIGSVYAAANPVFDLKKAKFLINLDMVGTGSQGITVVNSNLFPKQYQKMVEINDEQKLLEKIKPRGESCNSDHCPFYQVGVPSIFIYTMGDENREYHTVTDTYERMKFTEYEDLFILLTQFASKI